MPFPRKSQTSQIIPEEMKVIAKVKPKNKVKTKGKTGSVEDGNKPDVQLHRKERNIDVSEALKLRLVKFWSLQDIADKYGVSRQAVHEALQPFQKMITSPEAAQAYQENKANILSMIESKLAETMLDKDKLKAASLNNVAYSLQAIHNANRLERNQATQNISIGHRFMHLQDEAEEVKAATP